MREIETGQIEKKKSGKRIKDAGNNGREISALADGQCVEGRCVGK